MKFGKQIRNLRIERSLLVQELAQRANLSAASVSSIERGKIVPIDETANKLIDALEKGGWPIEDKTRNELYHALEKDRVKKANEPKESLAFGAVLQSLLEKLNLSPSDLKSRPRSTINAIVSGVLLPSDTLLSDELMPELSSFGASKNDLHPLYLAHLQDILTRSRQLQYLTEDKRRELLAGFMEQANRILYSDKSSATLKRGRAFKDF